MLVCGVIEIMPSNGRLPAELIEAGYRASQYGLMVFVLNDVTPQAVDLVLDPVVRTLPLSIPGVLYIKITDEQRVRDAVAVAPVVYVASRAFHRLAMSCGTSAELVHPDFFPSPRLNGFAALPMTRQRVALPQTATCLPHRFHRCARLTSTPVMLRPS